MSSTKDLPRWIYILKLCERLWLDDNWTERDIAIVSSHFEYLKGLTERNVMIAVGRTDVRPKDNIGLAIFQAEDEKAALEVVKNDPCIIEKIMTAELFPFHLALINKKMFSADVVSESAKE